MMKMLCVCPGGAYAIINNEVNNARKPRHYVMATAAAIDNNVCPAKRRERNVASSACRHQKHKRLNQCKRQLIENK